MKCQSYEECEKEAVYKLTTFPMTNGKPKKKSRYFCDFHAQEISENGRKTGWKFIGHKIVK